MQFGIERGDAVGDFGGRLMMVGDDHIDAMADDFLNFFGGGDAAVDGDQQFAIDFPGKLQERRR